MPKELNAQTFDAFLADAGDKTVLIDLWAAWCGPCRMLAPLVESYADAHPEVAVGKVDVDQNPGLAMRFGVMSIPTLLLFKNGELKNKSVGFIGQDGLASFIASAN